MNDQGLRQLARATAERAVAPFAQGVRHAGTGAGIGALGPDPPALAQDVGGGSATVAAHAAECDDAAALAELLGQVEHHLIDRGAVGLRPAATAEPQAAI